MQLFFSILFPRELKIAFTNVLHFKDLQVFLNTLFFKLLIHATTSDIFVKRGNKTLSKHVEQCEESLTSAKHR